MNNFSEFISLSNPTVRIVLSGVLVISVVSAVIGNFTFLRKRAMIGDAISHSVFPGIALSFIITEEKDPVLILLYAIVFGAAANFLIDLFARHPKVKTETSIGVVLSMFFGLGIVLISYIQGNMGASQAGLQHFIFGNAASISTEDRATFLVVGAVILTTVLLLYPYFKLVSFDPDHARSLGIKVRLYETILSILTVMAIAIGINAVGIILMSALLITPASAARLWTNNLRVMILGSVIFAAIAATGGTYISFAYTNMPTGPWVVVFLSVFAFVSILLAPNRGALARWAQRARINRKVRNENILKALYKLGEVDTQYMQARSLNAINSRGSFDGRVLSVGLRELRKKGLVSLSNDKWSLTETGFEEGKRVVRVHRLWEKYLANKVNLSADHVHPSAESLEHIITEEIEQKLLEELDYPEKGPHDDTIPLSRKNDE